MTPKQQSDVYKYITAYMKILQKTPTAECLSRHFRLPVADMTRALASWQEARQS